MDPLSNVRFTCEDGIFTSGEVSVDGIPIIGVTKAVYTLAGGNLGVLELTIDGVTADLAAAPGAVITSIFGASDEDTVEALAEAEWRWYWSRNARPEEREEHVAWADIDQTAADGWRERARHMLAVIERHERAGGVAH